MTPGLWYALGWVVGFGSCWVWYARPARRAVDVAIASLEAVLAELVVLS